MRMLHWLAALVLATSTLVASAQESATVTATDSVVLDTGPTVFQMAGLAGRRPGDPVLVFLNCLGGELQEWDSVLPLLREPMPHVRYNRPGIGGSQAMQGMLTPERASKHLKALLQELDVAPPYVFVGHSWGPTIALDYATRYPGEVVGAIYVDPTNIHTSKAAHDDMLRSLGATEAQLAALQAESDAFFAQMAKQMPPEMWSELEFVVGMDKRDPASWVPAQPRVPTIVLLAGRRDGGGPPPPTLIATLGEDAVDKLVRADNRRAFEARLEGVPGSAVRVVEDAGHHIHAGNPGVVAHAIDEVLATLGKP